MVTEKIFASPLWQQSDKIISCGSNETLENGIDFNHYSPLDLYSSGTLRSFTGCGEYASCNIFENKDQSFLA